MTRRFPDLNFAFLEGGVGWGCQLFADLIEHWERRGAKGIAYMDPKKLDRKLLRSLVDKYGYGDIAAELDKRDGWPAREEDEPTGGVPELDDFAACKISRKEDWVDLYARPYYFGCEADDRMNVTAFGRANPFGARINAIFSSDIGHFDVPDMLEPGAGGLRAGRGRADHRRRLPRLHLRQRRAPVGQAEPALLRGHARGQGSGGGAAAAECGGGECRPPDTASCARSHGFHATVTNCSAELHSHCYAARVKVKQQVRELFPTPLWVLDLARPMPAPFNARLEGRDREDHRAATERADRQQLADAARPAHPPGIRRIHATGRDLGEAASRSSCSSSSIR